LKTVLITGGSSGIGFELALLYAAEGCRLIIVSENLHQLETARLNIRERFTAADVVVIKKDLTQPHACIELYNEVIDIGNTDVLINCAGYGLFGNLHETDADQELNMFRLNMDAVYLLSKYFLKDMISRNSGQIINFSSNTSLQPVPGMVAYAATKSFVKHFSRSLSWELGQTRSQVHICVVIPPATRNTQFQYRAGMTGVRTFNGLIAATAAEVARDAYTGSRKGKEVIYAGQKLRYARVAASLLPEFIIKWILRWELSRVK